MCSPRPTRVRARRGARDPRREIGRSTAPRRTPLHKHFVSGLPRRRLEPTALACYRSSTRTATRCPRRRSASSSSRPPAEQLEVYARDPRRGLRSAARAADRRALQAAVTSDFTGLDKGLHNWRAYQELLEAGEADREPAIGPGPAARPSPLVPRRRRGHRRARGATGVSRRDGGRSGPGAGRRRRGQRPPVRRRASPRRRRGRGVPQGAVLDGLRRRRREGPLLEVAESEDRKGRHLADIAIFSTREGGFPTSSRGRAARGTGVARPCDSKRRRSRSGAWRSVLCAPRPAGPATTMDSPPRARTRASSLCPRGGWRARRGGESEQPVWPDVQPPRGGQWPRVPTPGRQYEAPRGGGATLPLRQPPRRATPRDAA